MKPTVTLIPLQPTDRERFILDNQKAFKYGATEEFGLRDDHFEEDGEIISRATIEASIDGANAEAYRILLDGESVGGAVISVEGNHGELELLFVSPRGARQGHRPCPWYLVGQPHPESDCVGGNHPPASKSATFTFTSIAVASTLLSSVIGVTLVPLSRQRKPATVMKATRCSSFFSQRVVQGLRLRLSVATRVTVCQ